MAAGHPSQIAWPPPEAPEAVPGPSWPGQATARWRSRAEADPARALARAGRTTPPATEARAAFRFVWTPSPREDAPGVEGGFGEGVSFVYRPEGDVDFEWGVARTAHEEEATGNAAEYWRATVGFRFGLPQSEADEGVGSGRLSGPARVFLSLGAGYHELTVSGGEGISGVGLYVGAGAEFLLGRSFCGGVDVKVHYFWGEVLSEGDDANGLSVAVAAGIGLRM